VKAEKRADKTDIGAENKQKRTETLHKAV